MAWEDFGQKVDLTARIREILINYPEGTPILKELVQNADDARATRIAFCLDHRQHPTAGLLAASMAPFQGVALLVFNNAVFSERDFDSISKVGDSVKREEAGKTGRFGIGFNSCYHITDLPSFVSGSHCVIFDPHCKYLPNISAANPGKKINLVEQAGVVAAQCAGQLAPYQGAFGCDVLSGRPWPGTLFRFPLRTAVLAANSNISKQVYDAAKVQGLLRALMHEAPSIMLFLKNIAAIEVFEWQHGASAPTPWFSTTISSMTPQLAAHRALFSRVSTKARATVQASAAADPSHPAAAATAAAAELANEGSSFILELQSEVWTDYVPSGTGGMGAVGSLREPRDDGSSVASDGQHQPGSTQQQSRFLVSQLCAGGSCAAMAAQLSAQFGVPLVAWAAVAADISSTISFGSGSGSRQSTGDAAAALRGQAFCFLPLPALTGLPVHVNAFFELSSNRRDIWYGEDMAGLGAKRAAWNRALLAEVAAQAWASLLVAAARELGPGPCFTALWPHAEVAEPWQALVVGLFSKLSTSSSLAVLHTPALGGRWMHPSALLLPDTACSADPRLSHAVCKLGLPLAFGLPPALVALLRKHMTPPPPSLTPLAVRRTLQGMPLQTQASRIGSVEDAPALLAYCLAGLGYDQTALVREQLAGLCVLPLRDGTLGALLPRDPAVTHSLTQTQAAARQLARGPADALQQSTGKLVANRVGSGDGGKEQRAEAVQTGLVFLAGAELEVQLLLGAQLGGLLVDTSRCSDEVVSQLCAISLMEVLSLASLTPWTFAHLVLPRVLPPVASSGVGISWSGAGGTLNKGWVELLWRWLSQHSSLNDFLGLPLLPVRPHHLLPLNSKATAVVLSTEADLVNEAAALVAAENAEEAGKGGATSVGHRGPAEGEGQDGRSAAAAAGVAAMFLGLSHTPQPTIQVEGSAVQDTDASPAPVPTPPRPASDLVQVVALLLALGMPFVDHSTFGDSLPRRQLEVDHCLTLDPAHVVIALSNRGPTPPAVLRSGPASATVLASGSWQGCLAKTNLPQRHALRRFLLTDACITSLHRLASSWGSGGSGSSSSSSPGNHGGVGGGGGGGGGSSSQALLRSWVSTLAALPIYPAASRNAARLGLNGAKDASGSGLMSLSKAGGAEGMHPDVLVDLRGECFMQPQGLDASGLAAKYVMADSPEAARVMTSHLGVKALSLSKALQMHVLPSLPLMPAAQRDALLLPVVRSLSSLSANDPELLPLLRGTAFLPTRRPQPPSPRGGAPGKQVDGRQEQPARGLHKPGSLYDPRVVELRVMLDPETAFPAEPWAGDEQALQLLVQHLGLRASAGRDTLLDAARFIERLAGQAAESARPAAASIQLQPPELGGDSSGAGGEDGWQEKADMAVARGKVGWWKGGVV
ncbi:hypothetical protein V8C86DRAFT_987674 [Haematococcus lacustris]